MSNIKCGVCEKVITPSLEKKYGMPGYPWRREATDVISDLLANVMILDDGKKKIVIISLDLLAVMTNWVNELRASLAEKFGLDPDSIMVAATHTHTGSPTPGGNWTQEEPENGAFIAEIITDAVEEALGKMIPISISFGEGVEDRVSFNRIYKMNDGKYVSNPRGARVADIVCPSAPIDYSVRVIRFDDENGNTVAQIVNYGNHADSTGGSAYCADWPGVMRAILKEKFGKDMVVLTLNGCCGNVNHVNLFLKEGEAPYDYKKVGECLGETVLNINENMTPISDTCVDYARKVLNMKRRQPTDADYEWAKKAINDPETPQHNRSYANIIISFKEHPRLYAEIELQALRIGDSAIATLPVEAFADTGVKIKAESPFEKTIVSELTNGNCGYVATEPVFSANTYESRLSHSQYLSATDADTMADTLNALMNSFLEK